MFTIVFRFYFQMVRSHRQLTLSPTKCTVMHLGIFGRHQDCFKYCIGNHGLGYIPTVTSVTDIWVSRVMTNSVLCRTFHNICTKASLTAKLILKCFQTRCTLVLLKVGHIVLSFDPYYTVSQKTPPTFLAVT